MRIIVYAFLAVAHSHYAAVTGEEGEDVELEQKGVRLFIKRGDKPFSEAIPGHIKLLANRATLEERIRAYPLLRANVTILII